MEYTKQKVDTKIRKNILDIEHQRYLTYFNIIVIFVITSTFTTALSFITEKISFGFLIYLLLMIISAGFAISFIFRNKMNKKLDEIRKL